MADCAKCAKSNLFVGLITAGRKTFGYERVDGECGCGSITGDGEPVVVLFGVNGGVNGSMGDGDVNGSMGEADFISTELNGVSASVALSRHRLRSTREKQ